jgi:hypothetical protein
MKDGFLTGSYTNAAPAYALSPGGTTFSIFPYNFCLHAGAFLAETDWLKEAEKLNGKNNHTKGEL